MSEQGLAGVFQLDNGYWGYRYAIVLNGKRTEKKKLRNQWGQPFDIITSFICSVLASVVAYYICKWLDDED